MSDGAILVTGAAGFIGFHVARRFLENGRKVVGLDNLNAYYDPKLKDARLVELANFDGFRFAKLDLADRAAMAALFAEHRFPFVVHLAAQAGVRYSLVDPYAYVDANLIGFANILEGCRHHGCRDAKLIENAFESKLTEIVGGIASKPLSSVARINSRTGRMRRIFVLGKDTSGPPTSSHGPSGDAPIRPKPAEPT